MTSPVLTDHQWPQSPDGHVYGPWMPFSGPPAGAHSQYRQCCHPRCAFVEYRVFKGAEPQKPTTERPKR